MTIGDVFPLALIFVCIAVPACAAARLTVASGIGEPAEGRLAAVWLYAVALLTLVSAALARLGALSLGWVAVAGLVMLVGGATLWVRTQPAVRLSTRPAWIALGLLVLVSAPQVASIWNRPDAVPSSTPWYFASLAHQYQEVQGVPTSSFEFGVETSALTDYAGFSSATAALNEIADGPYGLLGEQVMRTLACVGALIGFAALARALGANRTATISATMMFSVLEYYSGKLSTFKPESFGYALMFLVPAFVLGYLRHRRRSDLVAAAIGLAAVSQIHGISFAVCGLFVIGAMASHLPRLVRSFRRETLFLAGTGSVLAVAWLIADLALSGRLTQAGKATALPPLVGGGKDPSLEFFRNVSAFPNEPITTTSRGLVRESLATGFAGLGWHDWFFAVVMAVCLGLTILTLVVSWRRFLPAAIFGAVSGFLVVVACAVFVIGWDTFVPERTGITRVLTLGLALPVLLAAAALGTLSNVRLRRTAEGVFGALALVAVVASANAVFVNPSLPSREQLVALRALDLPDESVVLTNGYSEGFVKSVLGVSGYIDGRGPYHQESLLLHATDRLERTHEFLADPTTNAVDLEREGVTHLLIAMSDPAFGGFQRYPTNLEQLEARPDIQVVSEGPGFVLLEVKEQRRFNIRRGQP
jgi:hypothetical protein